MLKTLVMRFGQRAKIPTLAVWSNFRYPYRVTVIISGRGWMAADRRVTSDDGASSSLVKIAKNPWLIAAASGNATSTLDVRRAVRKGAWTPEDLIKHVDSGSHALVLLPSGDVHRIEDGRVWPAERGLQGIGSGADLALGMLWAWKADWDSAYGLKTLVRDAFKFVSSRRADCGGGMDFRFFPL